MEKYQIISFDRGMSENIKQDIFFETSQPMRSVLLLENYNPNIEHLSLIKRPGYLSDLRFSPRVSGNNYDTYSRGNSASSYITKILQQQGQLYPLLNIDFLKASNILYNDVLVLFLRRQLNFGTRQPSTIDPEYEYIDIESLGIDWSNVSGQNIDATGIVSYVDEYRSPLVLRSSNTENKLICSDIDLNRGYHEAFSATHTPEGKGKLEGSGLDVSSFKGWYILGTYRNSCRYGETILLVTTPENVYDNNLTKNSILFDNSFKTVIDNKATLRPWTKYLYPCYVFKLISLFKEVDEETKLFYGYDFNTGPVGRVLSKAKLKTWQVKLPTVKLIRDGNLDFCVSEPIYDKPITNPDTGVITYDTGLWIDDANRKYPVNPIQVICDYSDLNYEYAPDLTQISSDHSPFETLILPKIGNWIAPMIDDTKSTYWSYYAVGKTPPQVAGRPFQLGNYGEMLCVLSDYLSGSQFPNTRWLYVAVMTFVNYLQKSMAREFFAHEKIPVLITAMVNGNEIMIGKHMFELPEIFSFPTVETNSAGRRWAYKHYINFLGTDTTAITAEIYSIMASVPKIEALRQVAFDARCGVGPQTWYGPIVDHTSALNYGLSYLPICGRSVKFKLRIKEGYLASLLGYDVQSIRLYVSKPDTTVESDKRSIAYAGGPMSVAPLSGILYCPPMVQNKTEEDFSKYALLHEYTIYGSKKTLIDENWLVERRNQWTREQNYYIDTNNSNKESENYIIGLSTDKYKTPATTIDSTESTFVRLKDYPINEPLNLQFSGKYWKGIGARLIVSIKTLTFIGGCLDGDGIEEQAILRYCIVQSGISSVDVFAEEAKIQVGHLPHTALVEYREQLVIFDNQSFYRIVLPNVFDPGTWEFLEVIKGQGCLSQKLITITPFGFVFCNHNGIWISDGNIPDSLTFDPAGDTGIKGIYQKLINDSPYSYMNLYSPGDIFLNDSGFNPYAELHYNDKDNELVFVTPVMAKKACNESDLYMSDNVTGANTTVPETDERRFNAQIKLIYNFSAKNWRIETTQLPDVFGTLYSKVQSFKLDLENVYNEIVNGTAVYPTYPQNYSHLPKPLFAENQYISRIKNYSFYGKVNFMDNGLRTIVGYLTDKNNDGLDYDDWYFDVIYQDSNVYADYWLSMYPSTVSQIVGIKTPITGRIITHEIGDGTNDFILGKIILECSARAHSYNDIRLQIFPTYIYDQFLNSDPFFGYELRNRDWVKEEYVKAQNNSVYAPWIDIVSLNNTARGQINPFLSSLQTPTATGDEIYIDSNLNQVKSTGRESLVLLTPFNSKFRKTRFKLCSEIIVKVRTFDIQIAKKVRKSYG